MGTRYRKCLVCMFCIAIMTICGSSGALAAVRNVCKSGCAYRTIQSAIDAASSGDTVLVHDGIYVELIDFECKAITIRSVNGPGATVIDGDMKGTVVTFKSGEGAGSVLKGFTITNGVDVYGGGIYFYGSSPSIANCTISGNSADYGGGICCFYSSPSVANCTISGNYAGYGGGIYFYGSSPSLNDCTISENSSSYGGGIYCDNNSSTPIINCTISGNSADYGGGIYFNGSSPSMAKCTINRNSAHAGGGIYCTLSSSPYIINCTVSGNSAINGGGIHCENYSSPPIINCTVSGNSADTSGGGIFCLDHSSPSVSNCTVSGNSAANSGGGIYCSGSCSPIVVNSIFWGDYALSDPEAHIESDSSIAIDYSDVQGSWTGTNNINADPLFLDPRAYTEAPTLAGDYRLKAGSPCIDVGTGDTATYPCIPPYDITGDPRPQGKGYDMGSDEEALFINGSFEEVAERIPVPWVGSVLAANDGRVTNQVHQCRASFLMNGTAAYKQLTQTRNFAGLAGDVLDLSCWHRANLTSASGGFFGAVLTVQHADGTRKTHNLAFPKSTHGWQRGRQAFTALKNYTRVQVSLVYASQRGSAWFDDVKLSVLRP